MSTKGYAPAQLDSIKPQKSQEITQSIMELNRLGKPKNNADLEKRIDDYIAFCGKSSLRPGIETLCCALDISRTTFFRWTHGEDCDKERQDIIIKARQKIHAFLEQAVMTGAINPVSGIFLMKNWMGYKDTYSLEELNSPSGEHKKTVADIAAQMGVLLDTKEEADD